jgi:hypothetical protein
VAIDEEISRLANVFVGYVSFFLSFVINKCLIAKANGRFGLLLNVMVALCRSAVETVRRHVGDTAGA